MNISDLIIDFLAHLGIKHVFLLPGGGNMYLVDSIARHKQITPIPMLHEQSVGVAADAYSQFTNSLAVALVTTGPGATNAVTPCAAAWADSTPVLFISGQVKTSDRADRYGLRQGGFQETPITEIVRPITKKAVRLQSAEDALSVLEDLCQIATVGRPGPVWLDVPLDIQSTPTNCSMVPSLIFPRPRNYGLGQNESVNEICTLLRKASKPIFLLGNGIRAAGAINLASQVIELTGIPALLTWKALDFLDDAHPLNAGRPGAVGQRWANFAQQDCDVIIVIGARLDTGQTAYRLENFAPHAKKFVIDVDPNELAKFSSLGWTLIEADAGDFLVELWSVLKDSPKLPTFLSWVNRIDRWKNLFPLKQLDYEDGVCLYTLMNKLSDYLNTEDIFAPGSSGACSEVSMQAFRVKLGQRVLNSEGLGPMGFGIPGAIGACLASNRRRTFCVDGDGGFLMNIQELATVAINKLPIIFLVLNNNGYGSIKASQDSYFSGRRVGTDPSSGLGLPNLRKLADAFSIDYFSVRNNAEIDLVLNKFENLTKPVIIEVMMSAKHKTEPRVTSFIDSNNQLKTSPMEDMSPLLSLHLLKNEYRSDLSDEIVSRKR